MKNKGYAAFLLGTMILASSVPTSAVFAEEAAAVSTEAAQSEEKQENAIYGKITALNESEVTIAVGTKKQDDGKSEPSSEASDSSSELLDLTGEELTIKITDSTTITKQSFGMGGGMGKPGDGNSNGQPSQKPDGENSNGQPPQKPDGDNSDSQPLQKPDGENSNGQPPQKPDGDNSNGQPSQQSGENAPSGMPGAQATESITLADLKVDDVISITQDSDGNVLTVEVQSASGMGTPGGPGGMGGPNTQTYDYSGELNGAVTADGEQVSSDGETVNATEIDQNAILAENGGTLTVTKGTLTKSGDDTNGDNCNFYGLNSIALASGENSALYISNSSLSASSEGSNAIFATDNATVYAYNSTIETTAGNSRGLDATYGGTILADSMTIHTSGDHCASIATDRGGGTISASNSVLTTEGSGSPILYSTGDIQVNKVTGSSSGSQIAGMEGLNTILIKDSELTSTMTERTASDPIANGVIIYQSTSGDAETSTGETALFQAVNSTLSSAIESGSMFYVTNTDASIVLSGTELNFDSTLANLLQIEGNDSNNWGKAGSNGGNVTFTALGETLSGNISVDTISSLDLYLLDSTSYTGSMAITENAVNTNASDTPITVNLSGDSTWTVTGDSTITNLNAEDGAKIVDSEGNTVTIVADGTTVVEGISSYTVTVTGTYSNTVTTSETNQVSTSYADRTAFDEMYGTATGFEA